MRDIIDDIDNMKEVLKLIKYKVYSSDIQVSMSLRIQFSGFQYKV